ncbi:MAG: Rrf2 family transcriptional regulator [Polyangiaceae bacterium]|nr:Rrf2 family transcriptional regulator [Polyangiaceae bacterium]
MRELVVPAVKLSSKSRYALRALFDLAYYSPRQPVQIREIVDREGIPARFLEQIFQELKRAGIVASKRGPRGGYSLARSARDVRLGDVLRAVEGPVALAGAPAARRESPRIDARRATDVVLRELSARVESCFDDVTLADVCHRAESLGLPRPAAGVPTYVI